VDRLPLRIRALCFFQHLHQLLVGRAGVLLFQLGMICPKVPLLATKAHLFIVVRTPVLISFNGILTILRSFLKTKRIEKVIWLGQVLSGSQTLTSPYLKPSSTICSRLRLKSSIKVRMLIYRKKS